MEDRQDGIDGEEESALVNEDGSPEQTTSGPSGPSGSSISKTTRSGSPVPPKILYKSTTGKGVAFTQEDVQYLMDYMKYRKYGLLSFIQRQELTNILRSKTEQLDMVEFWNDLSERVWPFFFRI